MRQTPENKRIVQAGLHDLEDEQVHNPSWERPTDTMTEAETIALLRTHGAAPLHGENLVPGRSLLYVFPDYVQKKSARNGKGPCLARIDDPRELLSDPHIDVNSGETIYMLKNGGQVDFYTIDRKTGAPEHLSSRAMKRGFHVRRETLFPALDSLFPKKMLPA